jgi:hypothetical protein
MFSCEHVACVCSIFILFYFCGSSTSVVTNAGFVISLFQVGVSSLNIFKVYFLFLLRDWFHGSCVGVDEDAIDVICFILSIY